jgi:hypothetical protein
MAHSLSFRYHADMRTKWLGLAYGLGLELVLGLESGLGLGLGPAKVEVLLFCRSLFNFYSVFDHYNKEVIFR